MAELKVNSLRIRFERGSVEPGDADVFAFMRDRMKLRSDDLLSMYKDKSSMSVIIKFKKEEDMMKTLERLPGTMDFVVDKYRSCKVVLSAANSVVRYVRLFNLPPEIEDKEIWAVMSRYGNIQRMVRETYGAETGFPIWTSVRGLYVELKEGEEIPATVNVRNIRARVFYEGLLNKCYQCGSTEHIKVDCPQRRSVNDRLRTEQAGSYSGALKGVWNKSKSATDQGRRQKENEGTMTNLNALFAAGPSSAGGQTATSNDESVKSSTMKERDQPTESYEVTNTMTPAAEQAAHTQTVETGGATQTMVATIEGESEAVGAGGESPQHMEAEGFSLKRGRDATLFERNDDIDDSSLSQVYQMWRKRSA